MRTLLRIEEAKEREEARRLAECQGTWNGKKAKLAELEGYAREYVQRLENMTRSGVQTDKIRSNHAFILQLNAGIAQQRTIVTDSARAMDEQRRKWLRVKQRVDILLKTMDKMMRDEAGKERKQEQAIADEAAQRKFHHSE